MIISLLICPVVIHFFWQTSYSPPFLAIIALVVLWRYPLHFHPHKAYLKDKAESMKRKSKICAACSLITVFVLEFIGKPFALSAALGVFAAAVSRMIGVKFQEGKKC